MCGIAGIFDGQENNASLRAMVNAMDHRGPDDQGMENIKIGDYWLGLGHKRLSILDLSTAGHQPMIDSDTGNIIVFNGEIYNHREIRNQLPTHSYRSSSDTETILIAYRYWQEDILDRLIGMFAFAIWDAQNNCLFIARDRLGIKPIYFSRAKGRFVFASEIRSILAGGLVSRDADPSAIEAYLTFGAVQEPNTILKDVEILPTATYLRVAPDGRVLEKSKYWSSSHYFQDESGQARVANQEAINHAVQDAVSVRLISDAPLGAFLSGGVDSSVIVGMMALSGNRPETFCLDFEEGKYREGKYAEIVAKQFNCKHHNILVKPENFLASLGKAFLAMDQPTNDGINTYFVSAVTRDSDIKVALSGQGGDEVFAGYPSFRFIPRITKLQQLPSVISNLIPWLITASGKRTPRAQKIHGFLNSGNLSCHNAYAYQRSIYWDDIRERITTSSSQIAGFEWIENAVPGRELSECPVNQVSQFELSCYMRNTLLRDVDVFSMAHSLEVRVPLLDHRLVELMAGIGGKQKIGRRINKPLLVNTLKDRIPSEVVHRKKGVFWFPWEQWLRRDLKRQLDEVFQNRSDLFEMAGLHHGELRNLWFQFLSGSPNVHWTQVWTIFVLLNWMEIHNVAVAR